MRVVTTQSNKNAVRDVARRYRSNYVMVIGFPRNAKSAGVTYPETPAEGVGKAFGDKSTETVTVLEVALKNNFGSHAENIPPRPFMSASKDPAVAYVRSKTKPLVRQMNRGGIDSKKKIADLLVLGVVDIFKNVINDWTTPPNSELTIKLKGEDDPLVWTALMRNTLTGVVSKI